MHLVHYGKALAPSIELYKWIVRITFLVKKERKARKAFAPSSYPHQEFFGRILNKNSSLNVQRILTKLNLLSAPASTLATPASVIYYIYHCIELLLANAHSHIEELVFGTI